MAKVDIRVVYYHITFKEQIIICVIEPKHPYDFNLGKT